MLNIKRIYESPGKADGYRVLVDRLWPRGVSKSAAAVDEWLKDVGPTNELREWFGHKPERFEEFRRRYIDELKNNPEFTRLRSIVKTHKHVTLLFSARDERYNQAVVLLELLSK